MASVFLAFDTVLGREVALKMVHPHLLHLPETLRRFSNEAQAIATLSHEHIVGIYDYGEYRSRPFIVMEYINGVTLEELIEREGAVPPLAAIAIALQICSGLLCAHEKGIYHRDIKPANIIVDTGGSLRITDFGIAYLVNNDSVTVTGSFIGSPHYISPEQVSNRPVEGTTDIFSLGILLYRCCTGELPFCADTPHGVIHAICTADPPDPLVSNSHILFDLVDCVEWFLTKDPAQRPGAKSAFYRLHKLSDNLGLGTGKERLAAFIANGGAERTEEEQALHELFRNRAHEAIKQRRFANALRLFEQAARFGKLPPEDRKRIRAITRRTVAVRTAATGTAMFAGVAAVVLLLLTINGKREQRDPTPVAEIRTVPAIRTDTFSVVDNRLVPQLSDSSGGTHAAAVTAPSPHPVQHPKMVTLDAGNTKVLSMHDSAGVSAGRDPDTLHRPGFLHCVTNPPWVRIIVDGIERGVTPTVAVVPLTGGRHAVRLMKRQFRDWIDSVDIVPAETTSVRIRLEVPGKEAEGP